MWEFAENRTKAMIIAGAGLGLGTFSSLPFTLLLISALALFIGAWIVLGVYESVQHGELFNDFDLQERTDRAENRYFYMDQEIQREMAADERQAKRFDNIDMYGTSHPRFHKKTKKKKKGKREKKVTHI